MGRPVFFRPALAGALLRLDGAEGHHAAVVRRMAVGEPVRVSDGAGGVVDGVVASVDRCGIDVAVQSRTSVPPPSPRLTVVQAVPKGERAELAVQALTEVGVDRVVPWAAGRSQVRVSGERGERLLGKWRSWALEASKQSRRAWFCEVTRVASTDEVAAVLAASGCGLVLHENATDALTVPHDVDDVVLVVGPEGGITEAELAAFCTSGGAAGPPRPGVRVVRLGDTVLRTSTAGVVAAGVALAATRWR